MSTSTPQPPRHLLSLRGLWRSYAARRYAVLFYTLLATLAAGPLLNSVGLRDGLLEAFVALNLLAAAVPMSGGSRRRGIVALLASALILRLIAGLLDYERLSVVSLGLWSLVGLIAAASAVRFALRGRRIDSEHLYAAFDAYLLAGVFLGILYWTLERQAPGALSYPGAATTDGFIASTGIYFSFVTLATLGYGDIVPRSSAARGIAVVEAVASQLYLAVMVSRLVSLQISAAPRGERNLPNNAGPAPTDYGERSSREIADSDKLSAADQGIASL
ncbi:MAG: hypothetical protein IT424_00055 [Pirellulales bacterium]|nr:hypothetical protein [Pirellulales bacterium]